MSKTPASTERSANSGSSERDDSCTRLESQVLHSKLLRAGQLVQLAGDLAVSRDAEASRALLPASGAERPKSDRCHAEATLRANGIVGPTGRIHGPSHDTRPRRARRLWMSRWSTNPVQTRSMNTWTRANVVRMRTSTKQRNYHMQIVTLRFGLSDPATGARKRFSILSSIRAADVCCAQAVQHMPAGYM